MPKGVFPLWCIAKSAQKASRPLAGNKSFLNDSDRLWLTLALAKITWNFLPEMNQRKNIIFLRDVYKLVAPFPQFTHKGCILLAYLA